MPTGTAKEYRRTLAVQWANEGVKQSVIAERLGVTQGSVSQWVKRAKEGGKDALKTKPFPGHPPKRAPRGRSAPTGGTGRAGAAGIWV